MQDTVPQTTLRNFRYSRTGNVTLRNSLGERFQMTLSAAYDGWSNDGLPVSCLHVKGSELVSFAVVSDGRFSMAGITWRAGRHCLTVQTGIFNMVYTSEPSSAPFSFWLLTFHESRSIQYGLRNIRVLPFSAAP